ncbi:MAG TPA: indolepyruvate oxidoreductase subunit beta [Spirochaetota bacterium]|nr:indolepyruvate oxidoreductase subunit beta [Spirochaetota bacterium]HPS87881.1 indolepyruvate oxidoreductase subunit beta [Spirochaetota bacterium]
MIRDPYNIIITGVGGQGNVMAARIIGNMLALRGFYVTIGETFGASQRGGSVMSHLRVSEKSAWSPQIPKGRADLVVALEPIESLRVMAQYGNTETAVVSNTRPVYPVGVICGDQKYPSMDELNGSLKQLCSNINFIDATEEAIRLGNPILSNVIMIGAVAGLGVLPVDDSDFEKVMSSNVPAGKLGINMEGYKLGKKLAGG